MTRKSGRRYGSGIKRFAFSLMRRTQVKAAAQERVCLFPSCSNLTFLSSQHAYVLLCIGLALHTKDCVKPSPWSLQTPFRNSFGGWSGMANCMQMDLEMFLKHLLSMLPPHSRRWTPASPCRILSTNTSSLRENLRSTLRTCDLPSNGLQRR